MGPLGGGQEAVAGWAPWGRRGEGGGEGEDGGSKPRGHPTGALGRGWGSVKDGGSRHFLPIPPAPSVLQLNNAFRTRGSAVHKLHGAGGSWSRRFVFFSFMQSLMHV